MCFHLNTFFHYDSLKTDKENDYMKLNMWRCKIPNCSFFIYKLLLSVLFLLCVKINIVIIIKKDKRQRVKKIQNN